MQALKHIASVLIGFSSGVIIAGAVFAFITVIGVVPRLAQKTGTQKQAKIYEMAIMLGGILGTVGGFIPLRVPLINASFGGSSLGNVSMDHFSAGIASLAGMAWRIAGQAVIAAVSLCNGVFYGCLAMSLAEVLDVIPILTRRGRVQRGMFFFILAIALGKMTGSLLYFMKQGFYTLP